MIVGAMYRGACPHTAFKAGGNEMTEMAQISVADKGVATTSEKETIAHSNHVGLKFCQASSSRPYSSSIADESSGIMAFERRKSGFGMGVFPEEDDLVSWSPVKEAKKNCQNGKAEQEEAEGNKCCRRAACLTMTWKTWRKL